MEQSNPEQFQKLKTRVSGDSTNWKDPDTGEVRFLFIGDANPAQKKHYLVEREADDRLATEFINFGFDDNPLFFRNGERTADGHRVINELDRSLTGIYHDRLFKGLWVSAEGVVFREFDERRHVKGIEKPKGVWVTGIDFGYESPSVLLLCCLDESGKLTVWREVYKTGLTLDDLIVELRQLWAEEGIDSNVLVIDHDARVCRAAEARRVWGRPCRKRDTRWHRVDSQPLQTRSVDHQRSCKQIPRSLDRQGTERTD